MTEFASSSPVTSTSVTSPAVVAAPMSLVGGLVRAVRPKQWVKNLLVFAAPAAASVLDDPTSLLHAVLAFVAFSAVASSLYLLNDVLDVEADRRHPVKRYRPIARGAVPIPVALVTSALA